eukprot:TRINITY_DN49781_c0_g1_i2.p1 TRINITY_DN49781_c0_g1~~TRINITY_DN49781_c0_g1_i2.p1  ORF type:complete len:206 (+),score=27.37 TRINITY_DN49781_c0_g1_i2:79-696(+)
MSSSVGLAIFGILLAGVLALNGFFWWRFVKQYEIRHELLDASCELVSSRFTSGFKMGWTYPVFGPSWTDVPCNVELKVSVPGRAEVSGSTWLHLTYHQGLVWEYLKDSCSNMLPKTHEVFDCAYVPAVNGGVEVAFAGKADSLPDLPVLLCMKATGLSILTLGPLLLVTTGILRGAVRGPAAARQLAPEQCKGDEECNYAVLAEA